MTSQQIINTMAAAGLAVCPLAPLSIGVHAPPGAIVFNYFSTWDGSAGRLELSVDAVNHWYLAAALASSAGPPDFAAWLKARVKAQFVDAICERFADNTDIDPASIRLAVFVRNPALSYM